jgi:hypothetical protein
VSSDRVCSHRSDTDLSHPGIRRRHPVAQVEINTFSPERVAPSIYKDRMFTFSVWSSDNPRSSKPVQYREQVQVSGNPDPQDSIKAALLQDLDISSTLPIIPALPNGTNRHAKPKWRVQPISVMATAVKGHRHDSIKYPLLDKPHSYSDHIGQDSDSGFLVDVKDDGVGSPLSLEESQESWDDDLIAGIMDD